MSRRKGLVAAMEDESLLVEGGETAGAPEELATLPEAEISEGAGEIEQRSTAIEDAETDAETLGDVQDVMADSVETGEGLSRVAAEMAEVVVESICARLGITTKVMPSMESFGSTNSRKASTMLAMEGVGEQIARVWQAIKDAIIKLWNKIVAFVKKITNGNLALEKAAKGLKDRVAKLKGIPEGDKFEDTSICNAFGVEKVDAAAVKSVLAVHSGFCARSGGIEGSIKKCVEAVSEKTAADTKIGVALMDFIGAGIMSSGTEEKESVLYEKTPLINGECIKVTSMLKQPVTTGNDTAEGEVVFTYSFDKSESAKTDGKDVHILSKSEMSAMCDTVITLAKENNQLVANIEKGSKQVDLFGKAVDKLMSTKEDKVGEKEADRSAFRSQRSVVNFNRKAVGVYATKVGTFASSISGKNIKAGKAALNYVNKCANKYKSE